MTQPDESYSRRVAIVSKALLDHGWTCDMHEPDPDCEDCQGLYEATASTIVTELAKVSK